ncbi:MAG TPA: CHASE2 domain-containing protein, partial [candidate division Zixibacteria bacterium]|nr:CHASE2 domain-containing protein [candidate division Zixibacteria bacterium]
MAKYAAYILFLLISILVAVLYINDFGPLNSLQRNVNDNLQSLTASEDQIPNVVIVAIDGASQQKFGAWPWNHDLVADLAAAVAGGEPKVIVLDCDLKEDAKQETSGKTKILAEQLGWMDNVVLPYDIAPTTFRSSRTGNPNHLFDYSLTVDNKLGLMSEESSLLASKVFLPAERLLDTEPYLGFNYTMPDDDRVLRHQPMVVNYEGYYYPSLS